MNNNEYASHSVHLIQSLETLIKQHESFKVNNVHTDEHRVLFDVVYTLLGMLQSSETNDARKEHYGVLRDMLNQTLKRGCQG